MGVRTVATTILPVVEKLWFTLPYFFLPLQKRTHSHSPGGGKGREGDLGL